MPPTPGGLGYEIPGRPEIGFPWGDSSAILSIPSKALLITMTYLGTARFEKILDREKYEKELVSNDLSRRA